MSLVIPLPRRLLWPVPPATIQLQGRAEIPDWTKDVGTKVFSRFWIGRRILRACRESHNRGETRICFLRITLDPVITTYMVGSSIWQAMLRMESAAANVVLLCQYIPSGRRGGSLGTGLGRGKAGDVESIHTKRVED